ncbi:MAG: hypothetical protein ACP5E2_16460, partial [Terracidiphilus sp.]
MQRFGFQRDRQARSVSGSGPDRSSRFASFRRALGRGVLQLPLFSETICEVEHEQLRYVLRKNESEALRIQRRLTDKLEKLEVRIQARNRKVQQQPLCKPEAGLHQIQLWVERHKIGELIQ